MTLGSLFRRLAQTLNERRSRDVEVRPDLAEGEWKVVREEGSVFRLSSGHALRLQMQLTLVQVCIEGIRSFCSFLHAIIVVV